MSEAPVDDAPTVSLRAPLAGGTPLPSVLAGRYQLLEVVGEGGMGVVCRGFDLDLEETVAIKLLRADLAEDDALRARFRREVKLARRVTHPNVARVFEFGRDGPSYFLTMEFVDGESLQELLVREAPLPPGRAIMLATGLCEGLAAAHAAGVVHGDIKPGNVLVSPGRGAVLTDFGIAQALSDEAQDDGATTGTPLYMAPEQARGEPLSTQTDVYAVGVLLFAALTGAAPWRTRDATAIMLHKRLGREPDLSHMSPGLSPEWAALIGECLRAAPERRPADARALLARLATIGRGAALRGEREVSSGTGSPAVAGASPSGDGPRWIAVEPLRGSAELAWVGDDLVRALIGNRGLRVRTGAEDGEGPPLFARVDGEVAADGDEVVASVRVRLREPVAFVVRRSRAGWAGLGGELAARVAAAVDRPVADGSPLEVLDADVSELYVQARQAYLTMHYERALRLFEAALARAPNHRPLRVGQMLARIQWTLMGDVDGEVLAALRAGIDALVASHDEDGESHLVRARLEIILGEVVTGARSLRAAIARAPSLVEAHALLADLLLDVGRIPDAERRLDIALALDRGMLQAWHTRARQWAYEGRWHEVYALAERTLAELGYRSVVLLRLLLWRPDRALLERFAAVLDDNRDGLPEPILANTRRLVDFGLRRRDPRDIIREFSGMLKASPNLRRRCYVAQLLCELHCSIGDVDGALELLDLACDRLGLTDWLWTQRCPALTPLHGHPRLVQVGEIVRARADALADAIWS